MSQMELAKEHWSSGKGYDAGLAIWPCVDIDASPVWACAILEIVMKQTGRNHPLLDEVVSCALDASKWHDGHRVFDRVRREVLKLDEQLRVNRTPEIEGLNHILGLAELVAKVTYNATDPSDEFDEDSGAWIVAMAKGFATVSGDRAFEQQLWNACASV